MQFLQECLFEYRMFNKDLKTVRYLLIVWIATNYEEELQLLTNIWPQTFEHLKILNSLPDLLQAKFPWMCEYIKRRIIFKYFIPVFVSVSFPGK